MAKAKRGGSSGYNRRGDSGRSGGKIPPNARRVQSVGDAINYIKRRTNNAVGFDYNKAAQSLLHRSGGKLYMDTSTDALTRAIMGAI